MGILDESLGPLRWVKRGKTKEYVARDGTVVRYTMLIGPCSKCGSKEGKGGRKNHTHHITYDPPKTILLCPSCHDQITSVNSVCGWRQQRPLTNEQRTFLWEWFRKTIYFQTHRRLAGGVAAKLLDLYRSGGGQVTDAEVFGRERSRPPKSGQRSRLSPIRVGHTSNKPHPTTPAETDPIVPPITGGCEAAS